jgi:hypothetical protein
MTYRQSTYYVALNQALTPIWDFGKTSGSVNSFCLRLFDLWPILLNANGDTVSVARMARSLLSSEVDEGELVEMLLAGGWLQEYEQNDRQAIERATEHVLRLWIADYRERFD